MVNVNLIMPSNLNFYTNILLFKNLKSAKNINDYIKKRISFNKMSKIPNMF
jgi:hypothetical protein